MNITRMLVVGLILVEAKEVSYAEKHQFDLESGNVQHMINEWSRQSGEQVLFDYNAVRGKTTPVHGYMEDATALRLMLGDLPYTGDMVNGNTWGVTRIPVCKPWLADLAPPPPCRNPRLLAQL